MVRFRWIFWFGLILISACTKSSEKPDSLPQDEFIQVYFNHRVSNAQPYAEPYRQIERSGDNLESIIIREITSAQQTIDLAVQELNLPLVAQALVKSHRSGVRVRVILDNNYSQSLSTFSPQKIKQLNQRDRQKYQQFVQLVDLNQDRKLDQAEIAQRDALFILNQAGIPLIDDTADGSQGSGLMHHKFMVVDGQVVITGSTNFTVSGIYGDLDNLATRGNVNHLLRVQNSELANLFTEEFNYMWGDTAAGGGNSKFGLNKPWRSPKSIVWKDTQITLQFAPTSSKQDWQVSTNGLIAKTINQASKSINLALFVFSEQKIVNVLQQKQRQGVEIQGVFDPGFAYRYYSEVLDMLGITLERNCQAESANSPWTDPLSTIGIAQVPPGDKLHHKFTIIDHKLVISGSQNWSQAANKSNDEALIIISNFKITQHFVQEFNRLYTAASFDLSPQLKAKQAEQSEQCK
ncbi:MAG: phospholipase D-like domain-containing protein [Cyanobacteria bacterium P01_A01_bin.40]